MENLGDQLVSTLKEEDIFSCLQSADLEALKKEMKEVTYKKGDVLIAKGQKQTKMFTIEQGTIKKEGRGIHLLGKGEVSGVLHFFQQDISSYTLTAEEDSVVSELESERFQVLMKERPSLNTSFIRFLTKEVRKKTNIMTAVQQSLGLEDHKRGVAFFDTKNYMQEVFEKLNKEKGYDFKFHWFKEKLNARTAALAQGFQVVCCFVNDDVGAAAIDKLSEVGVRMVAMRCAGYDNVDGAAAKENKFVVTRVPAYSPYAVAEFAVTLMLSLNKKIHKSYNRIREHNFSLKYLVGFDMRGKTVGVFGTGKIGKCTIDILLGFGCKILCFDVYQDEEIKAKKECKYVSKEELFANSDIITLHAPLLPSTRHILNQEAFKQMKPGVMIINTSRGPLIDSGALVENLLSGKVGSAGLDVYEGEKEYFFEDKSQQNIQDSILARLIASPNVIVTSHQAFLTEEALYNIADSTLKSINDFLSGKPADQVSNLVKFN